MRVLYLASANLSLRRAHVYSVLKTSEAIGSALGSKVVVFAPNISDRRVNEPLLKSANIEFIFYNSRLRELFKARDRFDTIFFRSPRLIFELFSIRFLLRKKIVFECHRTPRNVIESLLWRVIFWLSHRVIFITQALSDKYPYMAKKSKVVLCNAMDELDFIEIDALTTFDARKKLSLPMDKKILVYTGNTITYDFGEVLEAIKRVNGVLFVIVGVTERTKIDSYVSNLGIAEKVMLVERTDHKDIFLYLRAADLLVVPYVGNGPGDFPVKIFEYMRAGKPIVSFRNDCIAEVLRDGENALLVHPPTAENWIRAINRILNNASLANSLAEISIKESVQYTWEKRGKKISQFIYQLV